MRSLALSVLIGLYAAHLAAAPVEGAADLNNQSLGAARLHALRAAEQNAAGTAGLALSGSDTAAGSTLQAYGQAPIGEAQLRGESVQKDLLTVNADVSSPTRNACRGAHYRKTLAVTQFTVRHAEQAGDLFDAGPGYALELLNALETSQHYLPRNAVIHSVYSNPDLAPDIDPLRDTATLVQLGQRLDAQFIISGSLIDVGVINALWVRGVNELTGLFGTHVQPQARHLHVALRVFDSLTGNALLQQDYTELAEGSVYFPNGGAPLRSQQVQTSDFGQTLRAVVARQVGDISATLDCLPWSARIVRVDKPWIYIAAGTNSRLRVGDSLAVYHQLDKPLPGVYYNNAPRPLGYPEELKTTVTLTQVQPSFAIGKLELPSAAVDPMDIVRTW